MSRTTRNILLTIVSIPVVVFVVAFVAASCVPQETPEETAKRIQTVCEREYAADGRQAVDGCFIRAVTRMLNERENKRDARVQARLGM